ncbi:MAG: alpha/beta fold hydrolase [Solirubrobacterales bacterium]|nr:alpha/beta fold hydrolase [Solirubrobacterales bacterium]MCB8914750.1 alpha/beta fold hydrolase [Thermoleophilales bacterium]
MEILRTPEERFESIPDFPWEPKYRQWEGMRLAHIDEGDGEPVLLVHGEPTWGFLWRKVMEPLLETGYRCIVPDLPGFGRSDKPVDDTWYTYDRHTAALVSLIEELDLTGMTLVCHDWGGPIGLRAASIEVPERFSRLVAMDTGLFTGYQKMSDNWNHFRDFISSHRDVRIDMPIRGGCATELSDEIVAAYEAPFPDADHKAGVRTFPPMIPVTPEDPGAATGQAAARFLTNDDRPSLLFWADSDPALPLDPVGRTVQMLFPMAEPLTLIENAGHFLQEDHGEEIGVQIADWLARTPV